MNITRRDALRTAIGAAAAAALATVGRDFSSLAQTTAPAPRRPNIVLILADDIGIDGFGCYGGEAFKTPNVDALAAAGMRFETCYCTPLCGPTRCQLLTGRYPFRTGGLTNQSAGLPTSPPEVGIARALKGAGYASACAGKWRQVGQTPADWGFDEYLTDHTANGVFWTQRYTLNGKLVTPDKEVYEPDVMMDFARDFLARQKDKPFFLYYSMHLVHSPIVRTPDTPADADKGRLYADNMAYLDKQVGQLVAELEKLKVRDNTLVLFSCDNGTPGKSWPIKGKRVNGGKGSMSEGGARVPLIASWPGVTPAGKVSPDLIDFTDFFPTFTELAGGKLPEGVKLDGRTFAPQLRGQAGKPREWVFVQLGPRWYARDRGWKLTESGQLLDMKDAPYTEEPVAEAGQSPEAAAARRRLSAVLADLNPAAAAAATSPASRPARARERQQRPRRRERQ